MIDSPGGVPETPVVYTIGHSNHSIEAFLALLHRHGIAAVVDVRSHPFSRRFPHFNRDTLGAWLRGAQIAYVFLGEELGARPADPGCYRKGRVDFEMLAARPAFQHGIEYVLQHAAGARLALMCAEKEPLDCHRTILVARQLKARGAQVRHILYDGALEDHAQTERRLLDRMGVRRDLFSLNAAESELLEEAYSARAWQIAYTVPQEGEPP